MSNGHLSRRGERALEVAPTLADLRAYRDRALEAAQDTLKRMGSDPILAPR